MPDDKHQDGYDELLEAFTDSVTGYERAAKVAKADQYRDFFTRRAGIRSKMLDRLRIAVAKAGGTVSEGGTIAAKAHRVFLSIAAALEDSNSAALRAVESGERHVLNVVERGIERFRDDPDLLTLLKSLRGELVADTALIDKLEDVVASRSPANRPPAA